MKHKLFRGLVALVLVCCMIVNCLAIKAEASALGGTALALFGDDAIALIAACLAGLGVMAKLETEMDTLTFRYLCEDAYDAMAAAGEWVVDGAVTVYNCATDLWDYGVDCGMVQWLHDWLYSEAIVVSDAPVIPEDLSSTISQVLADSASYPVVYYSGVAANGYWCVYRGYTVVEFTQWDNGYWYGFFPASQFQSYDSKNLCWKGVAAANYGFLTCPVNYGSGYVESISTDYDVVLGSVASPGTEIETEYGEYIVIVAPNGVPDTGGDGSGDDQPKIPIIPVPIMPSYEETIQLPQEDIWKGNKVETEDPDTGGSTEPSTGTDTDDPDSGSNDPTTPTTSTDTDPDTGTDVPPADIADYSVDLTSFFPFCLPFDIYAFFELLAAEPETPHLEFDIELPFMQEPWHVVIDLSAWDSTALLARRLELLAFIIGLCVFTREKFLRS